jgi:hypothetical protein
LPDADLIENRVNRFFIQICQSWDVFWFYLRCDVELQVAEYVDELSYC